MISDQRGLLAEMGKGAGDHGFCASSAVPNLSIQAIDSTLPGAKPAFPEEFVQRLDPLLELSFFIEMDIGRDRGQFKSLPQKIFAS